MHITLHRESERDSQQALTFMYGIAVQRESKQQQNRASLQSR